MTFSSFELVKNSNLTKESIGYLWMAISVLTEDALTTLNQHTEKQMFFVFKTNHIYVDISLSTNDTFPPFCFDLSEPMNEYLLDTTSSYA